MNLDQIQIIKEGFGDEDTFDYKIETLLDIGNHFFMEPNEKTREDLRDRLYYAYKKLIYDLRWNVERLERRLPIIQLEK